MYRQLFLITTEGCQGCDIIKNILDKNFSDIEVNIEDFKTCSSWIKEEINISDFPTLIFVKEKRIVYYTVGTKSAKRIKYIMKKIGF